MSTPSPERIQFFFDVMCPYAYQTSLWIREVRDAGLVEVDWRFFSLEECNRDAAKKHPWEREWSYGWSLLRIAALLRRSDPDLVDRWYAAAGKALHEDGRTVFLPDGAAEVAAEIGLPPGTVSDAVADPTTHDDVRADHDWVVAEKGGHGVPMIVFADGYTVFGPCVVPAPTGPAALRLWELVSGWREFPHLYEIRHPKTADDVAHIASEFQTYLATRQWRTVQKPAL